MASKTKLSKGILEMKFMKRTKDKVSKEADDAEGRAMYASQITDKMLRHGECPYIMEPSFVPCENLSEGRVSFRGMNPEIERLLELEEQARQEANSKNIEKDISDNEMTDKYYNNLASTVAKVFDRRGHHHGANTRRKMQLPDPTKHQIHNSTKRPRFAKPNED